MFGFSRSSHVNFVEKSNTAFRHLYLKGWTAAYETLPYPPSTGPFAVYTIPEFYDNVDFAMERVRHFLGPGMICALSSDRVWPIKIQAFSSGNEVIVKTIIPNSYFTFNILSQQYNKTQRIAIGTYHFSTINDTVDREMVLCKTHYKQGRIWNNQSFIYDSAHVTGMFYCVF